MNPAQEKREDQSLWGTRIKDKVGLALVALSCVAGMMFALSSVGYLLGFNATTLWLASISFTILGAGTLLYPEQPTTEQQLKYVPLALVPIAARAMLNGGLLTSFTADLQSADITGLAQVGYLIEVLGLWILVAVSEEGFRATVNMITSLALPDSWEYQHLAPASALKGFISVTAWIWFHFYQRGFNLELQLPYILWLYLAGIIFTYIMEEASFGAAVLAHIIVNLTA